MNIPIRPSVLFSTLTMLSIIAGACNHTVPSLRTDGNSLVFHESAGGYLAAVSIHGKEVAFQDAAAEIHILDDDASVSTFRGNYGSVKRNGRGIVATAFIRSGNGSLFEVTDKFSVASSGVFCISREVSVTEHRQGDAGFESVVSFRAPDEDGYDFFIPSILYKDPTFVRPTAIAADLDVPRLFVKESRTAIPLAMIRGRESGGTIALIHYHPEISVGSRIGGGDPGEISAELQFGSVGYTFEGFTSVGFTYPCLEGPRNYESGVTDGVWLGRYHPVEPGFAHSYRIALFPTVTACYNDAMMETFRKAYSLEMPEITSVDMDKVYRQNIELFDAEWKEFGTGSVKSAGLPWSLDLPDGTNREGVSFQMGFVGQQIAVGYHMYRYGLDHSDIGIKEKGRAIVDFWTSPTIMATELPSVWWDPADNEAAGTRRDYPSFLRCMTDGMEGLLDACRIAAAYGEDQPVWNRELRRVVSNIVERQNSDGSFCRAYRPDGTVEEGGDRNTFGTSTLNTPVVIRLLVKMYEYTGEDKYRVAALRAAEYSYNELYLKRGAYVGGTPDNPNTVDKEAAIYALYAFDAMHDLTGDEKYLQAAEHAALNAMSWVYCYDFAVRSLEPGLDRVNPFLKGGTKAFSLIATGHSAADNYIAYLFYELFKLYVKTGDGLYLHMARFIQDDTKLYTDFDGRMGFKYKAFLPEATNIANLYFRSVALWLPWCSIANIEPIVQMQETFGVNDVDKAGSDLRVLREQLNDYGSGGRALRR